MSLPIQRFRHAHEVARDPHLRTEVKRAILASWASDRSAVREHPALRKSPGARNTVSVDEVLAAMRALDEG